jgi:hypothetical protein
LLADEHILDPLAGARQMLAQSHPQHTGFKRFDFGSTPHGAAVMYIAVGRRSLSPALGMPQTIK